MPLINFSRAKINHEKQFSTQQRFLGCTISPPQSGLGLSPLKNFILFYYYFFFYLNDVHVTTNSMTTKACYMT